MDRALERHVWQRARARCEYCLMPHAWDEAPFEIDHVIAKKHEGATSAANLALSCFWCNSFKGPNIAGLDKKSRKVTPLFNPRRHSWRRHFQWRGAHLSGKSAIGRVTIAVLRINHPLRIALRKSLIAENQFP
jgi:hypothetical protein